MDLNLFYKKVSLTHQCGTLLDVYVRIESVPIDQASFEVEARELGKDIVCPTCKLKAEFEEKLKALERQLNERFSKVASYAGREF